MATAVHTPSLQIVGYDGEIIRDLDALQGLWTVEQYLRLTDDSNRLLEFTNGTLEVLPMPTDKHQDILQFMFLTFHTWLFRRGGKVQFAVLRLQIREGMYREPDLLALLDASDPRRQNAYWLGADIVMEVVSPDNPERDTVTKRIDYAEAHIPEYWIVNPLDETITVLRLAGEEYLEHGVFRRGETATSSLLKGLTIAVSDVFDAS